MKLAKRLGLGLLAVIALLALVGFVLPRKVHVERSIVINAPPEEVFARVDDLKRWKDWSPWYEQEPTAEQKFSGAEKGVGARMEWSGKKVGQGTQEITQSEWPSTIATKLDFGSQGAAESQWNFIKEGSGTKVTWGFDSDMGLNPIGRYFGLMMDSMLGPDYERGLAKLKDVTEKTSGGPRGEGAPEMPADVGRKPDDAKPGESAPDLPAETDVPAPRKKGAAEEFPGGDAK